MTVEEDWHEVNSGDSPQPKLTKRRQILLTCVRPKSLMTSCTWHAEHSMLSCSWVTLRTNFKQNYESKNKQRRELSGPRFDWCTMCNESSSPLKYKQIK